LTKILVPFATRLTTPLISNKHSGSLVPWSASAARIYLAVWIAAAAAAVGWRTSSRYDDFLLNDVMIHVISHVTTAWQQTTYDTTNSNMCL